MSSLLNFLNSASSVISSVLSALNGGADGCTFTLSGGINSVSFPVSPADFEVTNPYNNTTVNILNLGDINMIGKKGLSGLQFKSFFPAQPYSFVQTLSIANPYDYVSRIKKMAESGQPCTISITGTDVSMPCTIENFRYEEKDQTSDVYFSISLKEYRYIMPSSDSTNSVTELKSRIAEKVEGKQTTCYGVMSAMDTAQKVIQKTTTVAKQGERTLGLYKAMVKSGGIPAGTVLTTTAKAVLSNGKSLYTF